eukprot:775235_1
MGFMGRVHAAEYPGIKAEGCASFIEHCHKECARFIVDDSQLSGSISNLQFNSDLNKSTIISAEDDVSPESFDNSDTFFGDHNSDSSDSSDDDVCLIGCECSD